ncbi:unnamed protein product [Echinostoma caproni]|uniref:Uncharacterized protein n=1 Tax=Echinostoma caproni TaxID=27848 RepID=A0A183AH09_9TREM|nr:unnamed protein product [Echinostoma caproni]
MRSYSLAPRACEAYKANSSILRGVILTVNRTFWCIFATSICIGYICTVIVTPPTSEASGGGGDLESTADDVGAASLVFFVLASSTEPEAVAVDAGELITPPGGGFERSLDDRLSCSGILSEMHEAPPATLVREKSSV